MDANSKCNTAGEACGDLGYAPTLFSDKSEVATSYTQITVEERYALMALRIQRLSLAAIARQLRRRRSTIRRGLARNSANFDGYCRPAHAEAYARTRRSHSRRNTRFFVAEWAAVDA